MESNAIELEHSSPDLQLDEPHFDQESTVLSARPVVPLEVVEARSRSGRRWAVALAVGVALLIGGFAAALIYRIRGQEPVAINSPSQNAPQLSVAGVEAGVSADEAVAVLPLAPEQEDEVVTPEKSVAVEQKSVATAQKSVASAPIIRESRAPIVRKQDRQNDESADEITDRQELRRAVRRAEKWEERRLRRVQKEARRGDGDRQRHSSDDLMRIREIFEGSPRP